MTRRQDKLGWVQIVRGALAVALLSCSAPALGSAFQADPRLDLDSAIAAREADATQILATLGRERSGRPADRAKAKADRGTRLVKLELIRKTRKARR